MQIEEILNNWKSYDQTLDQHLTINKTFMRELIAKKANKVLQRFHAESWMHFALGVLCTNLFFKWLLGSGSEWKFIFPLALLLFISVMEIVTSVLVLLNSYSRRDMPILQMQKKLQRVVLIQKLDTWSILILSPVLWPVFIIGIFHFIGLDAFSLLTFKDWIWQIIGCIGVSVLVVWLLLKYPDKKLLKAVKLLKEVKEYHLDR